MKKIPILLLILLLTGCYDYKELNDLAIISGISIEKNNNTFTITTEIITPIKDNNNNSLIYTGTGKSVSDAFRKIIKESPKKLYMNHINILIIDKNILTNDLSTILDYFSRNPESRNNFYILIGKSKNILNNNNQDFISSKKIIESLKENKKYLGIANLVTLNDLISNYLNSNIELTLPSIELINNKVKLSTIGIFKNNKLIDYLNEDDSIIYNLIMNNINSTPIKLEYNNNEYIISELINTKTNKKIKNNTIIINIKGTAIIVEVNYECNMDNINTINTIQNKLNKEIEYQVYKSITYTINKYNTDIYGFKELYYKTNPKYFNTIKNNWYNNILKNINIKVNSNIKINNKGNLLEDTYVK